MNDYMTSKERLIFLDSKHKRTDPLFKTILCLMVVVAVAQVLNISIKGEVNE